MRMTSPNSSYYPHSWWLPCSTADSLRNQPNRTEGHRLITQIRERFCTSSRLPRKAQRHRFIFLEAAGYWREGERGRLRPGKPKELWAAVFWRGSTLFQNLLLA